MSTTVERTTGDAALGGCVADPQPGPPEAGATPRYRTAGALGVEVDEAVTARTDLSTDHAVEVPGRAVEGTLAGVSGAALAADGAPQAAAAAGEASQSAAAVEPQPQVELRVRAVYAVDEGASPVWTVEHIRAAVSALVTAANKDLAGTGYRYVFFPRGDVEVRHDRKLRQDVMLPVDTVQKMTSGQIGEVDGQRLIDKAAVAGQQHRNAVAGERPNAMLWLFSRGNRFEVVRNSAGQFVKWRLHDDRGGSFSGGSNTFVALHEGFLGSVAWARDDASRAVHEVGHYLGLGHTHREPFHDLAESARQGLLPANVLSRPPGEQLALWKNAVGTWLNQQLPASSTVGTALRTYDVDAGSGVLDTPADPGAGILALANQVAGHGANELGPVTAADVQGTVTLTPLRDNPMGYYLRETPHAMRFTSGQTSVMRKQLIDGGRRPLVAAQLGDSATPDLRVCAVWSPNNTGQRLTWGFDLAGHQAEHNRMRQQGFALTHQQAYTRNGAVVFDGIWDPGTQQQEILWGWLDQHVHADVAQRAAKGMVPIRVQGYQHLNHGPRYNVVYQPGSGDSRVLLGVTQEQLSQQWGTLVSQGYRMTCLSSHVDPAGVLRHSTVLRKSTVAQEWITGWTGADIANEYGRQWVRGWKIRHVTLARITAGHRWSAVFEPDTQGQLVYWAHVRERISEVYDQQWTQDFKLRSMWVAPS